MEVANSEVIGPEEILAVVVLHPRLIFQGEEDSSTTHFSDPLENILSSPQPLEEYLNFLVLQEISKVDLVDFNKWEDLLQVVGDDLNSIFRENGMTEINFLPESKQLLANLVELARFIKEGNSFSLSLFDNPNNDQSNIVYEDIENLFIDFSCYPPKLLNNFYAWYVKGLVASRDEDITQQDAPTKQTENIVLEKENHYPSLKKAVENNTAFILPDGTGYVSAVNPSHYPTILKNFLYLNAGIIESPDGISFDRLKIGSRIEVLGGGVYRVHLSYKYRMKVIIDQINKKIIVLVINNDHADVHHFVYV